MSLYTQYKGHLANKDTELAKQVKDRMEQRFEREYPQDPIILLRTIAIK